MTKLLKNPWAITVGSTILFVFSVLFFAKWVYAKQVTVDVVKDDTKTIKAEVVNIQAGTAIDIKQPFTADDKVKVKQGLSLTQEESDALDAVLNDEPLHGDKIDIYISILNKQLNEKPLHEDERDMLLGLNGKKQLLVDSVRYLSRKKVKDI